MSFTPLLQDLLAALRCLPGVGPKSSQRMAFHLLERDREGAQRILAALGAALAKIGLCTRCRMFAEKDLCPVCTDSRRDPGLMCVVETPADVIAIEESGVYRGDTLCSWVACPPRWHWSGATGSALARDQLG